MVNWGSAGFSCKSLSAVNNNENIAKFIKNPLQFLSAVWLVVTANHDKEESENKTAYL